MENWKEEAKGKLRHYMAKKKALEIIPMQIASIESTMTSIRSARADGAAMRDSKGNGREDMLLNCIVERDELLRNLERVKLWVECVDRGLSVLDQEDRKILDRLYIIGERNAVARLAEELFVEERGLHKRKDKALRKFTIALYGCTES